MPASQVLKHEVTVIDITVVKSVRVALLLFAFLCLLVSPAGKTQNKPDSGPIMLVGDVLSFAERDIWKSIFHIAGGEGADIVVVAAAHERAKVYGSYAVRALERYGVFVDLLPLAINEGDFKTDFREMVYDPEVIHLVDRAQAVFFVGGAPQRLEKLFYNDDGSATSLSSAVAGVHASGGLVVAGISGTGGANTGLDALTVLGRGKLLDSEWHKGLDLIPGRWIADQHFFSPGRIAETLVAMNHLETDYAIGMGPGGTALIQEGGLSVTGDAGVVVIDLSDAAVTIQTEGFRLNGARLNFLDHGDRIELETLELTPAQVKLDGFVLDPGAGIADTIKMTTAGATDMFQAGQLRRLMIDAIESEDGQSLGLAKAQDAVNSERGFWFRFYTGRDTMGWIDVESGTERYTIRNLYLDVMPVSGQDDRK